MYRECVLYTTRSPCPMCSGTALLCKFPRIVIAEDVHFLGSETWLANEGVQPSVVQDAECIERMARFIRERQDLWNEDIGL